MISIVICLYNESENVVELTERIYAAVKQPFELIYVVDGDDGTAELIRLRNKSRLKLDYSAVKRGFRSSFLRGFSMVSSYTDYIVTMDGDLNHRPEEIEMLVKECEGADVVIGSRYTGTASVKNLALWKRGISLVANQVIKLIYNTDIKDKTSGFRVYKPQFLFSLLPECKSDNFEFLFELLLLARKKGYIIKEAPIQFTARSKGVSKFELWNVAKGYLKLLRYYPPWR